MASHFLQLNDRISQGEGAPANGDALCTSTSLFPIGAIYIDNNTGILYARNTANGNSSDWVSQSGGSSGIDDVLAEGQELTAARSISFGGNDFLTLDPTAGSEVATLRAYNTTGSANQSRFNATTTDILAEAIMQGVFNGGAKEFSLSGSVSAVSSTISASADQIQLTGNVGVGVIPTVLFQVQSGGVNMINVDNGGDNSVEIKGLNAVTVDKFGRVNAGSGETSGSFTLEADYNAGAQNAIISGLAGAASSSIDYSADSHTFTGQAVFNGVQEFADNAAAITGGLATGAIYRTGDVLKIVH